MGPLALEAKPAHVYDSLARTQGMRPLTLDGSFNIGPTDSRYPRRSVSGG